MWRKRKQEPAHPLDPVTDQQVRRVRTLRANVASCEKQLASYQQAMDRAQKRRGYVGLDGISGDAYDDIMSRAEKRMPEIRREMDAYQKEAQQIIESLDINDRAFLSEG